MSQPAIGIDLGTTMSAVAFINAEGKADILPNSLGKDLTPSVIWFESEDNIIVGETAKEARRDDPANVVEFIKRSMGTSDTFHYIGQELTAIELSGMILSKLKKDAEAALNQPFTKAVITVPAYFGAEQRDATEKAARIAGIQPLALISEPTAAALAFGIDQKQSTSTIIIFDLGGGTFDVTLLRFSPDGSVNILETKGDAKLGGRDFDDKIIELVTTAFSKEHDFDISGDVEAIAELRAEAQEAKHKLESASKATIRIRPGGIKFNYDLTLSEFNNAISSLISGMELTLEDVLDSENLRPSDIDDVLLVGGSTRVKAVQEMVGAFFGKAPNRSVHPDKAVALGAAYFALKQLSETSSSISSAQVPSVTDIVPHSIGVEVLANNNRLINSIILPRKSSIPVSMAKEYGTSRDGQEVVELPVYEGEDEDLDYVKQIATLRLQLNEPRPAGSGIKCQISIDKSGIIRVTATDMVDGTSATVDIDYSSNLSNNSVSERADWLTTKSIS